MTGFLDSPDRSAESFWLAVTGSRLSPRRGAGGEFATLLPADGDAYLRFQVVGSAPACGHLDLHVDDVPAAGRRAQELGARVVRSTAGLVVLRSPAGLAFCLVRWAGEAVRPGVVGHGLVDQVCLDVPAAAADVELDFWAGLTGWARRPDTQPPFDRLAQPDARPDTRAQFERLAQPDGMPLQLVVQRVGSPVAGMHLDLACSDVSAEVLRQVALGASVQRVSARWTVFRDPVGRRYCVTSRLPFGGDG